jgi:hypothetical protein
MKERDETFHPDAVSVSEPLPEAQAIDRDRERTFLIQKVKMAMHDLLARPKMTAAEHQAYSGYVDKLAKLTGAYAPTEIDHRLADGEATPARAREMMGSLFPKIKPNGSSLDDSGEPGAPLN